MNYAAVINAKSGQGVFSDPNRQAELEKLFTNRGHQLFLQVVEPSEINSALEKALASPAEIIIVGGGDGTIASGADFLANSGKTMGILPLGTFNLEARALRLPLDPLAAAEALFTAEPREIDLLRINGKPCLCAVILGFYPTLAKAREGFHGQAWWKKSLRVIYEAFLLIGRCPVLRLEIETPEGKKSFRTRLAAFSPGPYRDSPGLMPERGELATGKMTAYLGEHQSRLEILRVGLKFITGTLFSTAEMEILHAPELTVTVRRRKKLPVMIDGETLKLDLPLNLKIEPRSLRVLHPVDSERKKSVS